MLTEIPTPVVAPVVRPSRRSRSMRGNFNSTKHPWLTFWRRRALPPEKRWALKLVVDYVPSLVAEKGGSENVTFAELKVIEGAAVSRVCWALALAAGDLEGVARFLAAERHALESIGLQRRQRPVPSLASILGARDADSVDPQPTFER